MNETDIREQAAKIFRNAANYIRNYGWQEKGMGAHGQPRCSMGALSSAHRVKRWDKRITKLMYDTLYAELGGMSLTQFNHKFKDGYKVAELYEKTAAKLQITSK